MIDYLPGVTRQDATADGGAWTRQPAVLVLHSTESGSWPTYSAKVWPHLTVSILDRQVRQHIPLTRAARALKNPAGGVETNRAGAVQVELIGTCDARAAKDHGWLYLPELHDEDAAWLGAFLHEVAEATGIPLTTSVEWRDYAAGAAGGSYGAKNGVRLTAKAWGSYRGVLGHMHVPENDHGDPGALPVAKVLEYANAVADLPPADGTAKVSPAVFVTQGDAGQLENVTHGERLPAFPLPAGHWFGTESPDPRNHSGYWAADRQHITDLLGALRGRGWKGVPDTDRYTEEVADLVGRYQGDAHLKRDERAGVHTWTSIAQSTIR